VSPSDRETVRPAREGRSLVGRDAGRSALNAVHTGQRRVRPIHSGAGLPGTLAGTLACLLALLAAGSAGCASYTTRLAELRPRVASAEWEAALAEVDAQGGAGDVLYHLERGALLHYAGRPRESNAELERALQRNEDLYTISLSERGLTFLLNDELEDYRASQLEVDYIHYFRLLNFIALAEPHAAAVEARRLAQRLAEGLDRDERQGAGDDAFLEALAGWVLASHGEPNAALIAYRRAYAAWQAPRSACQGAPPDWIAAELVAAARQSGIPLGAIGADTLRALAGPAAPAEETGSILLLIERGWTPRLVSRHVRIPIFVGDPEWHGEAAAVTAGQTLAARYHRHARHGRWAAEPYEIDYFLDVALPIWADEPAARFSPVTIACEPLGVAARSCAAASARVADLACRARAEFAATAPSRWAKTIARAFLKYAGTRAAERHLGRWAGVLANVAGVASEKADTRAWLLLPSEVRAARLELPAGRWRIVVGGAGEGGVVTDTLDVRAGEKSVRAVRLFPRAAR